MNAIKRPGRFWKEGHVTRLDDALARARHGAILLDVKFGPDWDTFIDLPSLDIFSGTHCILGQLCTHDLLWLDLRPRVLVDAGFSCGIALELCGKLFLTAKIAESYQLLTRAWKRVLLERRFQRLMGRLPSGSYASASTFSGDRSTEPKVQGDVGDINFQAQAI